MITIADREGAFGRLLQRHRQAAGLSQQELAERAGLSQRGIADLERGARHHPYPATVRRLVEALGLSGPEQTALLRAGRGQPPVEGHHPRPEPTRSPLPVSLSSFVGRELELRQVRRLLDTTRLLTLTGTGGVGKTRLVLALLREVQPDSQAGIAFVDLGPLADAELVSQTVASVLGIREQPDRSMLTTLIDAIHSKHLLLVLDNCEHLVQACAELTEELLRACPNLRILATSRERLDIPGETVWQVPSLSLPEPQTLPEQIERTEAVRLFIERARALVPVLETREENLRAAAEICRRLDGIPLALELAAAQVPLLSLEQIALRLDDALGLLTRGRRLAPARQKTVRAMLDWSYGLLTAPEQLLFERLAVFAGGWSLAAAEAVVGAGGLEPRAVLPLLGRLVDKSLVLVEPDAGGLARYRFLEPVRQYGLERLTARDQTPWVRDRHADFFLALAEQTEPALFGPGGLAAQTHLEREHGNYRGALQWLVERGETERAQRLAGALGRFWFYRGYLAEGEVWARRVLALPNAERPTVGRARTLYAAGIVALARGDYGVVEATTREVRQLWQALGNPAEEGFALFVLGVVARLRGDFHAARALLEAGVALSRSGGQGAAEANCLWSLAEVAYDQGQDREARNWAEAALARATDIGWLIGVVVARRVLGAVLARQGEHGTARALLEASLSEARALEARWWIAETLAQLGQLTLEQGDPGQAATWFSESLALARDLADRAGIARALEGIAQLALLRRTPRQALQLAGAATALRQTMRAPLAPAECARLERQLVPARRALGAADAATAWAEGAAQPMQDAIELALVVAQPEVPAHSGRTARQTLTPRELAVTRLVAQGLTNRQIAEQLVIAEGTVERHVGNILTKLDMTTRAQVAVWAVGAGVLHQVPTR